MSKIKLKCTYGGYKQTAQYGVGDLASMQDYQALANGAQEQQNMQGVSNQIVNVAETGVNAYQKFIEGKRKLANQINNGITVAAGVASIFTNAQLRRSEQEQKIQSLQGTPYDNSNRGINNIPVYTKYGGDVQKMKTGGTAAVKKYQQMLNDKYNAGLTVDGAWGKNTQAAYEKFAASQETQSQGKAFDPFRERQDLTNLVMKPHAPKLPKDAQAIYDEQRFRGAPYSIVSKTDENMYSFDADGNMILKDEVGLGKDRGDFANVAFTEGKQTTPAGEYHIRNARSANVADKGRKGYEADNFFEIQHIDPNLRIQPNATNPKYKDVGVAIHGLPTHLVNQRLPALNDPKVSNRMSSGCINCKKETLNSKYFTDLDERRYSMFVTPEPNNKRKYGGNGTNVEAEQGEVFDNGGDILKIDDNAPTHEAGGVNIMADRVLENTSSMHKDPMSKALKLDKNDVELLSGFKPKRGMSHADAYEFEAKKTAEHEEKILNSISKNVSAKHVDKYSIESAKLNVDLGLGSLPSENEIFDKYFENQETIKDEMGYYDGKLQAKYGKAQDGYINPYRKGKQKTPTGKNSNFPGTNEDWQGYKGVWEDNLGKKYTDDYGGVYDMQYDAYNWALENDKDSIRNMWKTYGLNNKAKQNGVSFDTNNLSDEQLLSLRNEYVDGLSGARRLEPSFNNDRMAPIEPLQPRGVTPMATPGIVAPTVPNEPATGAPVVQTPTTPTATPTQGEFNQPLEWYDTIGPAAQILSGLRRDPELYNPVNIAQVNLAEQDVRPALNNSQAEYNAASANLGNDSISAAQKAQMFSNKLRADNQVIGQYENANKQIQNSETQYNANARDRQEAANAQSRESFYTKVLQGRAKQEEQLLTGIDAMAKTFAENRAFNRNANLIMKLAPNFNEKGNYNGVPVKFASTSSDTPGFATNASGQPTVNEKGQYLLRSRTKDGKVSEEYVSRDYYDKITGNASSKQLQNKIILDMFKSKGRK
jgi:hypothetical protein